MGKSTGRKSSGGSGALVSIIVVVALVAIAGGAAWYFLLRSTPEKTVAKFLDAAQKGDTATVGTLMTEKSKSGADRVVAMFKQDQPKPCAIGKSVVSGATVMVTATTPVPAQAAAFLGGKTSLDVPFVCVKEKGKWCIDMEQTVQAIVKNMMSGAMGGAGAPGMGGAAK
jgi:hypothetical protein